MENIYAAKIASKGENIQSVYSRSSESSFSSDEDEVGEVQDMFNYKLRKNPNGKNPVCRRSKRVRKSRISDLTMNCFFQVKSSPISDNISDEDVAHCLIMLSRDKWTRVEMEFQEGDYDSDSGLEKVKKNKVNGKYRCETRNKLFRSYQALGGHRANHKRIKLEPLATTTTTMMMMMMMEEEEEEEEKIHECPFCGRVFSSGQALGGHKRSHFMNGGPISRTISPVKRISRVDATFDIDLNLPAPVDEDVEIR